MKCGVVWDAGAELGLSLYLQGHSVEGTTQT